jgi:hypothetical protein
MYFWIGAMSWALADALLRRELPAVLFDRATRVEPTIPGPVPAGALERSEADLK